MVELGSPPNPNKPQGPEKPISQYDRIVQQPTIDNVTYPPQSDPVPMKLSHGPSSLLLSPPTILMHLIHNSRDPHQLDLERLIEGYYMPNLDRVLTFITLPSTKKL